MLVMTIDTGRGRGSGKGEFMVLCQQSRAEEEVAVGTRKKN